MNKYTPEGSLLLTVHDVKGKKVASFVIKEPLFKVIHLAEALLKKNPTYASFRVLDTVYNSMEIQ